MQTIEYYSTVDKSSWDSGPWQNEPDKKQWQDKTTLLPCLVVRGPVGVLCGYVGVSSSHRWYQRSYNSCSLPEGCNDADSWCDHVIESQLSVHGGLTFSRGCAEINEAVWRSYQDRVPKAISEARRYPNGDSARFLSDWLPVLDTYEAWAEKYRSRAICHIPSAGEPDNIWWFGFDCAHASDYAPICGALYSAESKAVLGLGCPTGFGGFIEYRDFAYVESECASLAAQLSSVR